MLQVTIAEARTAFARLIETARNGEEVVVTENGFAIAKLIPAPTTDSVPPRRPGSAKGKILYMSEDFDAPLSDFAEYS